MTAHKAFRPKGATCYPCCAHHRDDEYMYTTCGYYGVEIEDTWYVLELRGHDSNKLPQCLSDTSSPTIEETT